MKIFALPFLTLLLISAVASSNEPIKDKDFRLYSAATSAPAIPITVNLRDIKQEAESPEEFLKHPFELEGAERPTGGVRFAPSYTPQHSFQLDSSASVRSGISAQSATTIGSPTLLTRFAGIPAPSPVQPDNTIAAGPNQIMLAVNSTVGIFDKTGRRIFQTTFGSWFASLNVDTTNLFDPRLLYDQYSKHFIFMCNARRGDHRSWYLFSVSKTSNPNGDWVFWALDMTLDGQNRVDLWADFPRIGVDENAIYLTGNMTNFITFEYSYAKLRVLKKSEVYNFLSLNWHDFVKLKDAASDFAFDITPAQSFGAAQTEYMVSTNLTSGNQVTLWSVADGGSDNPVLDKVGVSVSTYNIAPGAVQKGGGNTTNPGTPNPVNVVYRSGFIYTAIDIAHDWGSGEVAAIRYFKIGSDGTLIDEITFGSPTLYYFFPAVMVSSRGTVYLVYNRSGANQFIGAFYAGRKASDPPGKFSKSVLLQAGLVNYENAYSGSNFNRWGDYNGIARDPNGTIWIFSEYAKQRGVYGTVVGRLAYPK